jgi:hypothetical protein
MKYQQISIISDCSNEFGHWPMMKAKPGWFLLKKYFAQKAV